MLLSLIFSKRLSTPVNDFSFVNSSLPAISLSTAFPLISQEILTSFSSVTTLITVTVSFPGLIVLAGKTSFVTN